ncbi:hypothetical protein HII31_00414 [Pseudocercospora fuligena]|uniref:Uncharacterized protein n=1 Tax=Pseudocercospora fuligena TaxID=685502 RepID=A0A8H6VMR4_9PEZI|nr:hypothetical protein HII31_00414 [Pseudocercospora fuligena]
MPSLTWDVQIRCNDAKIVGQGYIARPSLGLYRLQRVNHFFRDYIAESKKLRRLMFLEPMDYPPPGNKLQYHAPLFWFLGHMVSGGLDDLSSWDIFESFTFRYDHPHTTVRKLSHGRGMIHLKRPGRDASWRNMRICTSADAAMLFPIQFVSRSLVFSFLGDFSHFRNHTFQKERSAKSTLGEFWDNYRALEAELRDVVAAFERHHQSQLAEREAFKAQAQVSPYMMYAMERQWACRDNTYEFQS